MDMTLNQRLDKFLYEKNFTQEQLRIKLGLKTDNKSAIGSIVTTIFRISI